MKQFVTGLFILTLTGQSFCQQTAAEPLPYTQDFEGTTFLPADWQAFGSNSNAAWEHSTTVGAYGNSSGSAYFDNFSSDLSGNYYGMRAPIMDFSSAVEPMLTFDVAYTRRSASNSDRLGIWYSFNGTTGWTNLMNFQDATLTTAPDQAGYFTPTAAQWDSITINLTQFAGDPLIRFAFENNCDFGNVMYIDNVRFYDKAFTGTGGEASSERTVRVYPNPATGGSLTIESTLSGVKEIRICDQVGKVHMAEKAGMTPHHLFVIDTGELSSGIYFVHIRLENGTGTTRKIIVE